MVYHNKIFVMGGSDGSTKLNDVWTMEVIPDPDSVSESSLEVKSIGVVWIATHFAVFGSDT